MVKTMAVLALIVCLSDASFVFADVSQLSSQSPITFSQVISKIDDLLPHIKSANREAAAGKRSVVEMKSIIQEIEKFESQGKMAEAHWQRAILNYGLRINLSVVTWKLQKIVATTTEKSIGLQVSLSELEKLLNLYGRTKLFWNQEISPTAVSLDQSLKACTAAANKAEGLRDSMAVAAWSDPTQKIKEDRGRLETDFKDVSTFCLKTMSYAVHLKYKVSQLALLLKGQKSRRADEPFTNEMVQHDGTIRVFDLQGRLVAEAGSSFALRDAISGLSNGVYFIRSDAKLRKLVVLH